VGQSGLPHSAALAALTINAAKIAGTADRLGSIAPGKTADLVVWNADPLEVTSYPEKVFIAGREQSLVTRQQTMGERYLRKYQESGVIPPNHSPVPSGK
jgi:imidazolonepropionase-like amidohydrolase